MSQVRIEELEQELADARERIAELEREVERLVSEADSARDTARAAMDSLATLADARVYSRTRR